MRPSSSAFWSDFCWLQTRYYSNIYLQCRKLYWHVFVVYIDSSLYHKLLATCVHVIPEHWHLFISLAFSISTTREQLAYRVTWCLFFYRFNYRSTHHLVSHGFYNFLNWFDERAWYPLGRIVGGTVSHYYFLFCLSFYSSLHAVDLRKEKRKRENKQNKQENSICYNGL